MNDLDEREISLIDLIYYLLRRYRSILLMMVIGALLVTSGAFIKTKYLTSEEDFLKYEQDLLVYNTDQRLLSIYEDNLKEEQNALVDNPLITIPSHNLPTASISLCIEQSYSEPLNSTNYYDPGDSIIDNVDLAITKSSNWVQLSEKYGISNKFIKDLISINPDYNSNIVTIDVYGKDLDTASELLNDIVDVVENNMDEIISSYRGYYITKRNSTTYIDNTWVNDIEETAQENINNYINQINTIKNKYKDSGEPEAPDYFSIKDGIKYVVIGAFVGLVLMAGIYCVIYMLNDLIREEDEIHSYFGFSNLGTFAVKDDNPKSNKLDQFLLKKQYGDLDDEFVVNRIADNINLLSKEDNKILLIGNIEDTILNNLYNQLNAKVNKGKLILGGNINKDNQALTKLSNADSIILVEKRNSSKMKDVLKEGEIVKNCNKQVIGYIQF